MKGFAQCAKDEDVQKYFTKGKVLSQEFKKEIEGILLKDNIQPPASSGGTVTSSTIAPFSERLMMFCNFLLGSFSLGGQGFSATFLWRNDLTTKIGVQGKDILEYTREGLVLMMDKGWLEEPPKMEL